MSCFPAVPAVWSRGGKSKLTGSSEAVTGQERGSGSSSSKKKALLEF